MNASATKKLPGEGYKRVWPPYGAETLQEQRLTLIGMDESVNQEMR